MAIVVMDALSHQAIREQGTEGEHYGAPPDQRGQWRGRRLAGIESGLAGRGHAFRIALPSADELAAAKVLIIASRSQALPFESDNLAAIRHFVLNGGGLLLMANHRNFVAPQQQVATTLKLPLAFKDLTIDGYPAIEQSRHPVTDGVTRLRVRNTSALSARVPGEPLARFSADRSQFFAVACTAGKGRVVATGDSGFIASLDDTGQALFESESNAQFFLNAVAWLSGIG